MIRLLSSEAASSSISEQLGLDPSDFSQKSTNYYASFMRRVCAMHCPMPRGTVIRLAKDLLSGFEEDVEITQSNIEAAVDGLFEAGDLLELSRFTSSDENFSGDWIFLAPPSYMRRESGKVFIFGIAPDDATFLPLSLQSLLKSEGPYRYLFECDKDVVEILSTTGLRQISESQWQPSPKKQTAKQHYETHKKKLLAAPPAGTIDGIKIFVPKSVNNANYKDRLKPTNGETGFFIGRRPANFGAEHWCFFQLNQGAAERYIDLPLSSDKVRGCDAAWHLQLAAEFLNGNPENYITSEIDGKIHVTFSFPLPLWAIRRFRAIDNYANVSPFYRTFPLKEWSVEKRFIEEQLWFVTDK